MTLDDADDPVAIELDFVAHALLAGLRAHVVGRADCPTVRAKLTELCGPLADEISGALLLAVRLMASRSQRRLRVHLPHCQGISVDEMMWLSAVADAQARAGTGGCAPGSWTAKLAGVSDPALEWATADLARVLTRSGRRLPAPQAPGAPASTGRAARAFSPTLH